MDRVTTTNEQELAFITLNDHKDNFTNKPSCRLINPCKPEIGKISKKILDRINDKILTNTHLNQSKNTTDVIKWFERINNKHQQTFISFDIIDFYPSI